jgi:hypothetical protein
MMDSTTINALGIVLNAEICTTISRKQRDEHVVSVLKAVTSVPTSEMKSVQFRRALHTIEDEFYSTRRMPTHVDVGCRLSPSMATLIAYRYGVVVCVPKREEGHAVCWLKRAFDELPANTKAEFESYGATCLGPRFASRKVRREWRREYGVRRRRQHPEFPRHEMFDIPFVPFVGRDDNNDEDGMRVRVIDQFVANMSHAGLEQETVDWLQTWGVYMFEHILVALMVIWMCLPMVAAYYSFVVLRAKYRRRQLE